MNKSNLQRKKEQISLEILDIARSTLLVNLRFLSAAFARLGLTPYKGTIATNAEKIFFDPEHVISLYKTGKEETVRAYLHIVLHCMFQHPFVSLSINRQLWNLACDIAVEAIICEWNLPCMDVALKSKRQNCLAFLESEVKILTAEKIYAYLRGNVLEATLRSWETLFVCDDHEPWYIRSFEDQGGSGDGEGNSNDSDGGAQGLGRTMHELTEKEWKELSERLQTDLETFSSEWGNKSGNLVMSLKEVNRERYDYAAFLNKFAVMNEIMRINDEEYDNVFYTYGLSTYGNLPLVEPLEYKESKQIKEFVIAIDTSGSVLGEKVQAFIRKTYNILKQQESFSKRINLHIVQCDATIQKDTKITSLEDLETFFGDMKLYGFGGTDFRPVFNYVDQLITQKELINLKGLIYFTDGFGPFPNRKPPYETAFVFLDDNYNNYNVPPWAMKLILETKDL